MIANRELGVDDYFAILRRRLKVILIATLLAPLAGFLISFIFSPLYTSYSLVLVEGQTVPAGYVKPIVTEALSERITSLRQQVLSRNRLLPVVNRLGLATKGKSADDVIDDIRSNISITPADVDAPPPGTSSTSSSPSSGPKRRKLGLGSDDVPAFFVSFKADNPRNAQQICGEITSLLLEENLRAREQVALNTTDFLSQQMEQAKHDLDARDKELATFKNRYLGQLPSDVDNNLKILAGLNSQLEANTQMLNRAQQDKSYTESILAPELAAWKASQTSLTSETIQHRLAALQTELVALQSRYTPDYPEVIKAKEDIAAMKARLEEMKASEAVASHAGAGENRGEPAEILQLRSQIHQSEDIIAHGTSAQTQLQEQIAKYQSRLALSPTVEEQYNQLTRDYDSAQKFYDNLLTNKNESEVQTEMEHRQQGEQMTLLDAANLPDSPSFPVRWKFAAIGLGAGLALGLSMAMWLEFRDKAIRNEADVLAGLELPMLTLVPWVGPAAGRESGGFRDYWNPFRGRKKAAEA